MAERSSPERTLLKALGAYLRATPSIELPTSLRRFREFRPQALWPHRDKIMKALDDDVLKARIKEWLDDSKTKLPRVEASALRSALDGTPLPQRPARVAPPADKSRAAAASLERAKQDARKAREEARKAKESAAKETSAARTRTASLDEELRSARSRIAELERDLRVAQRALEKAEEGRGRDARRLRKETDKIVAERDEARKALKDERKARREVEREADKLRAAAAVAARPRPKPAPSRPRKRRPLRAPKGLMADHPKTLDKWLSEPGVTLLIDGYNVTKSKGGFGDLLLEEQRERLVQLADQVARKYKISTTVVFDGDKVPAGITRRGRGPAKVEYSRPEEIADDHLIARIEELPPDPVILVTSDKELQRRAAALGATIVTSKQLLTLHR
jgi:predicted RNA-binding protein with PIN domain